MCGRIVRSSRIDKIAQRFAASPLDIPDLKPSFNIPPSSLNPTIVYEDGERRLKLMSWGLKPWSKRTAPSRTVSNIRTDTLVRGSFRGLLMKRRCIVPADGFYEWEATPDGKRPVLFQLKGGGLFGFAGLFTEDDTQRDLSVPPTFSIFTAEPNALVRKYHDRMPVILSGDEEGQWLNPEITDPSVLLGMLRAFPAREMQAHYVSTAINSPKNDSEELLKAILPPGSRLYFESKNF